MSESDFKSLLNVKERERNAIKRELIDAEWAQLGRDVDRNIRDTRFAVAIQVAILAGGTGQQIANRIATFLLTGTITR